MAHPLTPGPHHECPDRSGYPRGSKSEEPLVEARIVRVADVFASLVEERSYKPLHGGETSHGDH